MIFLQLFLLFFYLKVARVHTKQEKVTLFYVIGHIIVAFSGVLTLLYAFSFYPWYLIFLVMWIYFMIAALMVTAVQVGIFVDGISVIGISTLYKFLPLLTLLITTFTAVLWLV